jgi:cobalt-zinc-cadmium efflux system protein
MGHQHKHSHDHSHESGKNLAMAFLLNLFFCIVELIGGLLTNSMAILSDALHDFGDSLSLGLAWYLQKVSGRKPDLQYTYGYKRFSTLSALVNSVVLLLGSGIVLYECVGRLFHPVAPDAKGMLLLAFFGLLVNGFAAWKLSRGSSLNERTVSLHLLEDVLGWVAVLIVSIIMMFVSVPILDPLLSIGISIFMLYNVYRNLKNVFRVFLQGKPDEVDGEKLIAALKELHGVEDIHDWHIWSMDNEFMVSSVHLVVSDTFSKQEQQTLRSAAHQVLKSMGVQHATIEIESASETCEWCEAH